MKKYRTSYNAVVFQSIRLYMKKRSVERLFIRGKIIRNNQINDCVPTCPQRSFLRLIVIGDLSLVVAMRVVNFAFVEYGRSLEEAFEELFDTKRDNPITQHRYAVYDEERAHHNRH